MKAAFFIICLCLMTVMGHGQPTAGQTTTDKPYAVVNRDANSRVWERATYETLPSGRVVTNLHHYTELATGLNHLVNGQWVESKEEIDLLANGGAAATNGQHQVYFPGDIYAGQIEMVTPDGRHLKSRPLGLSYFDGTNSVLIGQLTNSMGYLAGSNQVIYPDAFMDLKADLRYTYTKAGFEQDIILREQPLTPESYGLDPDTSRLEVLTEFFDPPQPKVTTASAVTAAGRLMDQQLDFGVMQMARGRAFLLGDKANEVAAPVNKQWLNLEGRTFLVEEVPVNSIVEGLVTLPLPMAQSGSSIMTHVVSKHLALPPQRLAQSTSKRMLTQASLPTQGFVLDYVTLNASTNNYTFQSDTTYYISGFVNISGTTTIEGGAVFKYTNSISAEISASSWVCKTAPYRMAVFTSKDDNSIGETITGSTGNPTNTRATYLAVSSLSTPGTLAYMRFVYAGIGLQQTLPTSTSVANPIMNCQFINCVSAIGIGGYPYGIYGSTYAYLGIYNVLFSRCGTAVTNVYISHGDCVELDAENITADQTHALLVTWSGDTYASYFSHLKNSILTAVTNEIFYEDIGTNGYSGPGSYAYIPAVDTPTLSSGSGVYQTVGAGNYYLANGSPYQNAGTNVINSTLLAQLRQKTTYPPVVYTPETITYNPFGSQMPRDTETPGPDLGYHYDPIDYAVSGLIVTNAAVTVNPGTVIAAFGTNTSTFGLSIGADGQLTCEGSAVNLNRIVTYNTVQEEPGNGWQTPTLASVTDSYGGAGASFDFRFTDWSLIGPHNVNHLAIYQSNPINLRDCQFHGGGFYTYFGPTINLTNCLFERVYLSLYPGDTNNPSLRNNTFFGGTMDLFPFGTYHSVVQDNLFDHTTIVDNYTPCTYSGYNAYVTNCNRLQPTTASDIILTNSPAYQTGPLGNYYEPTNSRLINAGSDTVDDVGLTGYTILTNQTPDTGMVDMGYHYSAFSPPSASDSSVSTCPATPNDIFPNASDPYSLPLVYIALTSPIHGTLINEGSGHFIYTPTSCYEGTDHFTFKVNDGIADSGTATVTLTTGDTAFASSLTTQTCKNTPLEITLSGSDSCGKDSSTFTYIVLASPTNGVLLGTTPNLTYSNTSPTFTGVDSFTFKVTTPCGNSATGMVSITVGDQNISANPQTAMTGTNEPLNLTLTASSVCTNSFIYTIVTGPSHGTLSGGTGANRTYTPNLNYEGTDSFIFAASDGVWSSMNTVTFFVVAGPTNLTAQCDSNGPGTLLNWSLDAIVQKMEADDGLTIAGFEIYRRTTPGTFTTNDIIFTTADSSQTNYLDVVAPGTTNYYKVDFLNDEFDSEGNQITYRSPYSIEATNVACLPPILGTNGVDVAFILDNTGSMLDINESMEPYQNAIINAVTYIEDSFGGNCRFALVTPDLDHDGDGNGHDIVDVRIGFTNNVSAFEVAVEDTNLPAGGGGTPESTDECLNTVVNALIATGRQDTNNCAPPGNILQFGDFRPAFRTNAVKLVVLITDANPGGFCDGAVDVTADAHQYALEAANNHIQINAIQIGGTQAVMQDYATTTCGWSPQLDYESSSGEIEAAILNILYTPDVCH